MRLEMVDFYQWDIVCQGKTFGKTSTHQQTTQQTRTASKSNSRQLIRSHPRTFECRIHYRNNIQLVRTTSQLRHHATKLLMHGLRSRGIAQQHTIAEDCCGSVIATRFDC